MAIGTREIPISYGGDMRNSTLRIPAAKDGIVRSMNTVARLAAMAKVRPPRTGRTLATSC